MPSFIFEKYWDTWMSEHSSQCSQRCAKACMVEFPKSFSLWGQTTPFLHKEIKTSYLFVIMFFTLSSADGSIIRIEIIIWHGPLSPNAKVSHLIAIACSNTAKCDNFDTYAIIYRGKPLWKPHLLSLTCDSVNVSNSSRAQWAAVSLHGHGVDEHKVVPAQADEPDGRRIHFALEPIC